MHLWVAMHQLVMLLLAMHPWAATQLMEAMHLWAMHPQQKVLHPWVATTPQQAAMHPRAMHPQQQVATLLAPRGCDLSQLEQCNIVGTALSCLELAVEAQQVAMHLSAAAQQVAMLPWVAILPAPTGCPMSRFEIVGLWISALRLFGACSECTQGLIINVLTRGLEC
jgi:hypothetical protein